MNCNSETEVHHWEKKIGTAICQPVDFFCNVFTIEKNN